jgi:hypothetical protein
MEGKMQNAASEWGALNQLLQHNTNMTEETNQLTKKLREEQRKDFLELKQTCEKKQSDHQDVWDMLRENQRFLREWSTVHKRERQEAYEKDKRERQEAYEKDKRERQEAYERDKRERQEAYEREKRERQEAEEKFKREREESDKRFKRKQQESDKRFKRKQRELDKKYKRERQEEEKKFYEEVNQMRREWMERNEALNEQMKVTDMKIQEMSRRFSSTTGHIIEGLMSSAAMEMFQKAGFDVYNKAKNLHHKNKSLNAEMEVDVLLTGDTTAVVIEVKASCDRKDVDHVLKQMEKFRLLYPEYHDKEVVVAIAAINYELDADIYAHEKKLMVVRADSRNVFTIDSYDMDVLQRF